MADTVLDVQQLSLEYRTAEGSLQAIRDVSFFIQAGEALGIVGESGSGKSTIAYAIMRYLAPNAVTTGGAIRFRGEDLLRVSREEMRAIRGQRISMVYQDPENALNPALTVARQMTEALTAHDEVRQQAAYERSVERLREVNIPDPESSMAKYPHQLSGGQKQRVVIAMALCGEPDLLILDEPTTALDVTTEAKILDLIEDLKRRISTSILYITHDLGVIARVADRVAVTYAGEIVEVGTVASLLDTPRHPYTMGLLDCVPGLDSERKNYLPTIPGTLPDLKQPPPGCIFAPRCPYAIEDCTRSEISLQNVGDGHESACIRWRDLPARRAEQAAELDTAASGADSGAASGAASGTGPRLDKTGDGQVLELADLYKHYGRRGVVGRLIGRADGATRAVDGVSLTIGASETVALVGESGSGKTTIAETVIGLTEITAGGIAFKGQDIRTLGRQGDTYHRQVRIVFQNPDSSLNPKKRIRAILARPLRRFGIARTQAEIDERLHDLMDMVRLSPRYLDSYPAELSGGEKQRIAVARAFATEPELVVCDEPTSALDVSVQASILNLLIDLQARFGTSYLFISHDLSVVRHIADRVAILYLGQVMEVGDAEAVFTPPHHPYTRALLSSIPVARSTAPSIEAIRLPGSVPSAKTPPGGCPFHTRCPQKVGAICEQEPPPRRREGNHEIVCQIPRVELSERPVSLNKETKG